MNSISLSTLTTRVEEAISLNFGKAVWIRAEISELRENNGHCYMELIEKSEDNDFIIAKCRATCWASTYRMLKPYFESSTGQRLTSGLQILVSVTVEYHSVYGLNLNIKDIDPVYTVGEMAAQRTRIIRQLENDGIAEMNKLLPLPLLCQRVAIISSPTAAGYEDFLNQIKHNPSGFKFYTKLFTATMQGAATEASVIAALDKIYRQIDYFDVVVIIRGGGATADLAAFDSYLLAMNCAQFPIPVISGIGHQRDISILDMVAHTSVKTPTAAAEFLIENLYQTQSYISELYTNIQSKVREHIRNSYTEISQKEYELKNLVKDTIYQKKYVLHSLKDKLHSSVKMKLAREANRIESLNNSIQIHSPQFLVQHGYTITTINGKRLNTIKKISKDDIVKTYLADGKFESIITSVDPE